MRSSTPRFKQITILAVLAASLLTLAAAAHAQVRTVLPVPVKFRKSIAAAVTYTDTTTINGNWVGARDSDTTAAVDARTFWGDYQMAAPTGTLATTNAARIALSCTAIANVDSFFVIVQGSADGINWQSNGTEITCTLPSGGGSSNVLSGLINSDPDNISGGNAYLWPYWRFIIRPDGNGAALASVQALHVIFPSSLAVGAIAPTGDGRY